VALQIERYDDLVHGDEIKALFLRNERPTFPAFFDRAYPLAYAAGGASWVARDGQGTVIGHLAVFPRRFCDSARQARAALLMDALFDPAHRNFFNAVALARRVVVDLRDSGFDFAYTDPTPLAVPILKAVGFTQVDTFDRFIAPLNPLYLALTRLRTRARSLEVERLRGWDASRLSEVLRGLPPGTRFRAERSPELYAARLGGESISEWEWLLFHARRGLNGGRGVAGLALAATPPSGGRARIVDLLWDENQVCAEWLLVSAAAAARASGYSRLNAHAPRESALAQTLGRSGFVRRGDGLPLLFLRIRQDVDLPPLRDWVLTYFDGSAW
jgi:hypothetical protein